MVPAAALLALLLPSARSSNAPLAEAAAPPRLWIDARRGKDVGGDGSQEQPFQTIAKALSVRALMEEEWVELRLQVGFYAAASGEPMPVVLPSGVRLVGYGPGSCELGGKEGQPVVLLPRHGRVAIESVALRGGSVGIEAQPGGSAPLEVQLVDVRIEEVPVAVELSAAQARVHLRADGLRTKAASIGLHAGAGAPLSIDLSRCTFSGGTEGLVLDDSRVPPEGALRDVALRDCRFEGSEAVGFVRRGANGHEQTRAPWLFERCEFRGARMGMMFELPGGDVPLVVRDCTFLENTNFGVSSVGSGTTLDGVTRFERCTFRWNGIGAQFLAAGRAVELDGCRVEDSIGIGLLFGNFTGARSTLRARDSTIVGNGAAGVFAICEQQNGIDVALAQCTIADNRGSGVERKDRKFGSGTITLTRCVVSGNATDVVKIEPAQQQQCHVGGDPRFRARERRDYRLADDTPARDSDGPFGALSAAAFDGK